MERVGRIVTSLVNIVNQDVVDIIARESYCPQGLKSDYSEFYNNSEYKKLALSPKEFNSVMDALSEEGVDVITELASDIKTSFTKVELLRALAYFADWYDVDNWPTHKTIPEIADTYAGVWLDCLTLVDNGYPKEVLSPKVFEEKLYFLYTRGGTLVK